jgi:hypothetical protein
MFKDFEIVKIKHAITSEGKTFPKGTKGTIVHTYEAVTAYIIEVKGGICLDVRESEIEKE